MIRSKPARFRTSAPVRTARSPWAAVAVGWALTGGLTGCCLPDPIDFLASVRCGSTPWSVRCTGCADAGFCGPTGCSTGGCATGDCGVVGGYDPGHVAARPVPATSVASHEPSPGEAAHQAAVDAMKSGRFEEADARFAEALRLKPDDANLLCDVGYAQILMGDYPAAEETLRDAQQLAPSNKTAMANLGLAVGAQGRTDEAAAIFRRHRTEIAAWIDAGEAARTGGQLEAARTCYERALALSPRHPEATQALAGLPAPTRFAAAPQVAPASMAELQPLPRSSFGAAPATEVPLLSPEAAAERIPPRSSLQFPQLPQTPKVESSRPAVLPAPEDGARTSPKSAPRAAETATVPLDPPGPPPRHFAPTVALPAANSAPAGAADTTAVPLDPAGLNGAQPVASESVASVAPASTAFRPHSVGAASRDAVRATATRPLPATGAAFAARPAPNTAAADPVPAVAEAAAIRPTAFEEPAAVLPFVPTTPAATESTPAAGASTWKPSRPRPVEAKANWNWSGAARPSHPLPHPGEVK